ncbi:MAG: aconitate hydratase, partial [Aestuariivirga sp.]
AKGTNLLGVRAVIAQSFERIHRSNLVGMGVVPLQFMEGQNWESLGLKGDETIAIKGLADGLKPRETMTVEVTRGDGTKATFSVLCRIDTLDEIDYYKNGGILQYVLRNLAKAG